MVDIIKENPYDHVTFCSGFSYRYSQELFNSINGNVYKKKISCGYYCYNFLLEKESCRSQRKLQEASYGIYN